MRKANLNFNNIEVKKSAFHKIIDKVDVEKIVNTNKNSYGKNGFKYFLVTKMMIEISHCVQCLQK